MATKSMEWYKTAVLAELWDEEAKQRLLTETQWFDMMWGNSTNATRSTPEEIEKYAKDKEVELGTWKPVWPKMTDEDKQKYVDWLSDYQYWQMQRYKNQWYSFEAAKALLENQDRFANPMAVGVAKYNPKGNIVSNIVWWAYDSATGLPRMLAKWIANAVWWTAKQLGADEEKTNALVQNYKDYLDRDWSGKSIGANTDSLTYKRSKKVWDLAQTFAYWALWWAALEWTKLAQWANALKNTWVLWKMAVWAAEWAADMWIYSMVSDSELPSGWDLLVWWVLWAAAPMLWATYKWAKGLVKNVSKKAANEWSEYIISKMAKLTPKQEEKFFEEFWEQRTKRMHDRNLYTKDDLIRYYKNNIGNKDAALATMKWRYRNETLDKIIDDLVDYAKETEAPNLEQLVKWQKKNAEWWLEHIEIEKIKRLFESKKNRFNYDSNVSSKVKDKYTNRDTALREWQQKITKESWLSNIAEINNETQAAYMLKKNLSDITKTTKNGLTFWDFALALLRWDGKEALWYLVWKKIASSPTFRKKSVQLLDRISWHTKIEYLLMDYENIARVNSEKEFAELLEKRWVWDKTPKLWYEWPEVATDNRYWQLLRDTDPTVKYEVKEFDKSGKMFNDSPYNVPKEVVEWKTTNPK